MLNSKSKSFTIRRPRDRVHTAVGSALRGGEIAHAGASGHPFAAGNARTQNVLSTEQIQDTYDEKSQFMNRGLIYGQLSTSFLSQRKKDIIKSYKKTVTDFAGLTFEERLRNQTES